MMLPPIPAFLSDNAAGAHPDVLEAVVAANHDRAAAYGADDWTERSTAILRRHFGADAHPFLVFGGTAANVLALAPLLDSHESILCARSSHLWIDECGAAEHALGCKLVPIETADGKLRPSDLEPHLDVVGNVHHSQPRVVSVTQATEWGTVYQVAEFAELAAFARENSLRLHVDGARFANAAATLNVGLGAAAGELGIDSLSLGATKNGLLFGEAVIVFDPSHASRLGYYRKQAGQLHSKMRFIAAQFEALFGGDLWLRNAQQANTMAQRLAAGLSELPDFEIVQEVEANAVFFRAPRSALESLRREYVFHPWEPRRGINRLVTAFDTTIEDVDTFVEHAATTE